MTDDIRSLTARLAADPGSLVFLPLAEALRRRGQLDAALVVAQGGVRQYPQLADAHDLMARIRTDRGEGDLAFDAWTEALRHDPGHVGALRGLAYLAFRTGDTARAERHLRTALAAVPDDPATLAALQRVRSVPVAAAAGEASTPLAAPGETAATLLADGQGRRLAGSVRTARGEDVSEPLAAEAAGVGREAERTARLLELGEWRSLNVECEDGQLHFVAPAPDLVLVAMADPGTPAGRLAIVAERAAAAARRWLERLA